MELLREKSDRIISNVSTEFKRYLFGEINWNDRLIIIKGARGTGKTTILLQHIKLELNEDSDQVLYVSLDDMYFVNHSLSDFVREFALMDGKFLFLDEVHKYKNWAKELKNIYDFYPEVNVVATGSSALEIFKSEVDLSRRASVYALQEMSLREYLKLNYAHDFPVLSIKEILSGHKEIAVSINSQIKPIKYFSKFLLHGAYPFFMGETNKFQEKLAIIINTVIENDLPAIEKISYETVVKLKKLLLLIATAAPFKPNVSELSQKTGTSRDQLLKYLNLLERAAMISMLRHKGIATSMLTKPEKVYLSNTNLFYALDQRVNIGSIRETFFQQQLRVKHQLSYTPKGDFLVDNTYSFEVGGPDKTNKQISGVENAYIAADGIEYGFKNKIPLWLFGFLY